MDYPPQLCPACGTSFLPRRRDQSNCSTACKVAAANLEASRAREAYRALYHWVYGGSPPRKRLINALSQQARAWRDEDRAKGRKPPPLPSYLATEVQRARWVLRVGAGGRMGLGTPEVTEADVFGAYALLKGLDLAGGPEAA